MLLKIQNLPQSFPTPSLPSGEKLNGSSDQLYSITKAASKSDFFGCIKQPFVWLIRQVKWFLSVVFFCCAPKELKAYKSDLKKLRVLKSVFRNKESLLGVDSFKKWWRTQFQSLDARVQKLFFVEYFKEHKPRDVADVHRWALEQVEKYPLLAQGYVIDLGKERVNGIDFLPKERMPTFIQNVEAALEVKIRDYF